MGIRKRPVVFPCYATHQPLFFALYFHIVTNPFSRNPFRFTSIQNQGVGGSLCALSRHSPLPLCFHQLAVSLASPKKSTPLQSSKSGLFFGNPGVGYPCPISVLHSQCPLCCASSCISNSPLATSPLFSAACRLLVSLASLFRTRTLCFQQLAASFCKTRGVGGIASRLPLRDTRGYGVVTSDS